MISPLPQSEFPIPNPPPSVAWRYTGQHATDWLGGWGQSYGVASIGCTGPAGRVRGCASATQSVDVAGMADSIAALRTVPMPDKRNAERKCEHCGGVMDNLSLHARFCCRNCAGTARRHVKNAARRAQRAAAPPSEPKPLKSRPCVVCGKTFTMQRKNMKFCVACGNHTARRKHSRAVARQAKASP